MTSKSRHEGCVCGGGGGGGGASVGYNRQTYQRQNQTMPNAN